MKLDSIQIGNFKSLKHIDIHIDEKINLFIGKNNSGMSNLVQGILLLRKSVLDEYKNYDFIDNVFGKELTSVITFNLSFTFSDEERKEYVTMTGLEGQQKDEAIKSIGNKLKYVFRFDAEKIVDESVNLSISDLEFPIAKRENSSKYLVLDAPILKRTQEGTGLTWKLRADVGYRESILHKSRMMNWQLPEEYFLKLIWHFMDDIYYLNANRFSKEIEVYEGSYELKDDASNLPQRVSKN